MQFYRYSFSENFDTKIIKIGQIEPEIWPQKGGWGGLGPQISGAHKMGPDGPPGPKVCFPGKLYLDVEIVKV